MQPRPKRGPDYLRMRQRDRQASVGTRAAAIAAVAVFVGLLVAWVQDSQRPTLEELLDAPAATSGQVDEPTADSQRATPLVIQDCASCPEMMPVRGGRLAIGLRDASYHALNLSPEQAATELPLRWVEIEPFAMARTEVTRDAFALFVEAADWPMGRCNAEADPHGDEAASWRDPGFDQSGKDPVVCVNRQDAEAYAGWISRQAGTSYRLPTEAEWEWAARAETHGAWFWGDDVGRACAHANIKGRATAGSALPPHGGFPCADGFTFTAPVDSFQANPFGLLNVLGNAAEWTSGCMTQGYPDHPVEDSADCAHHVVRGGSWADGPAWARASARQPMPATVRSNRVGFRLVRDLSPPDAVTPR
ncbi:MAG: formylglycine-generating enzyme family protein [Alphaproteobacteria bacterium]